MIINFKRIFTKETADINIIEKITTPEELSGFFNLVVEGQKSFLDQGGFSQEKTVEELWKINSGLSLSSCKDYDLYNFLNYIVGWNLHEKRQI